MSLKKLYEKINGLVALEIFDYPDTQETLEKEFEPEFIYLRNMTPRTFADLSDEEKYDVLRIYDVYFRNGMPMISDKEYDEYYSLYEGNDKDKQPIMFEPNISAWKKVKHDIPMGSLSKCNNIDEIESWNMRKEVASAEKVISEKLDGISLEIVIEKGKFVRAVTRGDGKEGDDITANAMYFDGVVKELDTPMDCAIRGELVILKENLPKINKILIANGKDPLKNTRNGVAGQATKFKDRNEDILSLITFVAYEIQVFDIHETGENVL